LFGNKHILNKLRTTPSTLATFQMISTALLGCAKMYLPRCPPDGKPSDRSLPGPAGNGSTSDEDRVASIPNRTFLRDMMIVGTLRFVTVVAGLLSLKFVAVSFTETVKSSAPFFTVLFSWMLLRERTSLMVNLSLVPVVGGLAICSATEISFNMIGFYAAVFNNCIDCVQNVFSKKLLTTQYTYVQLQFYTSAAALLVQLPFVLLSSTTGLRLSTAPDELGAPEPGRGEWSRELLVHLVLNGISFHMQSVAAYAVMSVVSPVTQSVLNTLKRAMLIWLSVLWFGNPVTIWSAAGTLICVAGVLLYNYARQVRAPHTRCAARGEVGWGGTSVAAAIAARTSDARSRDPGLNPRCPSRRTAQKFPPGMHVAVAKGAALRSASITPSGPHDR
jgi:solute carrier family 35 protein E2